MYKLLLFLCSILIWNSGGNSVSCLGQSVAPIDPLAIGPRESWEVVRRQSALCAFLFPEQTKIPVSLVMANERLSGPIEGATDPTRNVIDKIRVSCWPVASFGCVNVLNSFPVEEMVHARKTFSSGLVLRAVASADPDFYTRTVDGHINAVFGGGIGNEVSPQFKKTDNASEITVSLEGSRQDAADKTVLMEEVSGLVISTDKNLRLDVYIGESSFGGGWESATVLSPEHARSVLCDILVSRLVMEDVLAIPSSLCMRAGIRTAEEEHRVAAGFEALPPLVQRYRLQRLAGLLDETPPSAMDTRSYLSMIYRVPTPFHLSQPAAVSRLKRREMLLCLDGLYSDPAQEWAAFLPLLTATFDAHKIPYRVLDPVNIALRLNLAELFQILQNSDLARRFPFNVRRYDARTATLALKPEESVYVDARAFKVPAAEVAASLPPLAPEVPAVGLATTNGHPKISLVEQTWTAPANVDLATLLDWELNFGARDLGILDAKRVAASPTNATYQVCLAVNNASNACPLCEQALVRAAEHYQNWLNSRMNPAGKTMNEFIKSLQSQTSPQSSAGSPSGATNSLASQTAGSAEANGPRDPANLASPLSPNSAMQGVTSITQMAPMAPYLGISAAK